MRAEAMKLGQAGFGDFLADTCEQVEAETWR